MDHSFHRVAIARVVEETADAASFVLDVPEEFTYEAGQFCTFRVPVDGADVFRCYSMASSPDVDGEFKVTVKRVPDGVVSNWMLDNLVAGALVDVSRPTGVFTLGHAHGVGDVVAFAAGSGVTPVIAVLKTALATTDRPVRLLYANRDAESIIFRDEIDALADKYGDRFVIDHHLDADAGFVTVDRAWPLMESANDADVFICGPGPFMDIVEHAALMAGFGADRIHIERFTAGGLPFTDDDDDDVAATITVELNGKIESATHHPGATILQTARQMGLNPPYSCEMGNCATCMARLVEGTVKMHVNDVLTDDEVEEGWVLTCQSVPTSPSVRVIYE